MGDRLRPIKGRRRKPTADGHARCPCGHAWRSHEKAASDEEHLFEAPSRQISHAGGCLYCGESVCPEYGSTRSLLHFVSTGGESDVR